MPSKARLKKYRNIKEGPEKLKFGASKIGVGGSGPPPPRIRTWGWGKWARDRSPSLMFGEGEWLPYHVTYPMIHMT